MDWHFDLTVDGNLLNALDSALTDDDLVPAAVHEFALAVFDLGTLDVELAALTHDSLVHGPVVASRADDEVRTIIFSAANVSIRLDISADRSIVGQVVPEGVDDLRLQTSSDVTTLDLDEFGEFSFVAPEALMRLTLKLGGHAVVTPWVWL